MCIRDRLQFRNELAFDFLHARQPVDAHEQRGVVAQVVKPCLLYTSDAADERSSVDLGGRRIIKKKKKKIK